MTTRQLLTLLCLVACAATLLVQPTPAQTPDTALAVPTSSPSETDQAVLLMRACVQLIYQGKFSEAGQNAEQALALSQKTGNLSQQIKATNILATVRSRLGQGAEAIRLYQQAAEIAALANDRDNQALGLARAGNLLRVSGLYAEALNCLDPALALYRQQQNLPGEVRVRSTLASIYTESGDFAKAQQQLQEAAPLVASLNDKVLEEVLLLRHGMLEKENGNNELALKFGLQALALDEAHDFEATKREVRRSYEQTLDVPITTFAVTRQELLLHLGTVYGALDNPQKSAEFLERAMQLAEIRSTPLLTAVILGNVAGTQLKLGKAAAAREQLIKAITMLRASGGSKHWEATFLYYLAEANRVLGINDEAIVSYRQAIDAIEQARMVSIPSEVSRAGIVSARHEVFAGAIDFMVSQHREDEAFEIAEAWHARAFLDILTESRIDIARDLSEVQRNQEDKLFVRISRVQKELWNPNVQAAREQELKTQLAGAENNLESFQVELHRTNPRYADVKYPRPLKSEQLTKSVLDSETALVEFVVSDQKSFAWAVYRGKITSVVLPPRPEIDALITDYRTALSQRVSALTVNRANARISALSARLYQKLFASLEPHFAGARRLIIVPDGALLYLPFETLMTESDTSDKTATRYLIERFAISYAPSATALGVMQETRKPVKDEARGIIAFGDPVYEPVNAAAKVGPLTSEPAVERRFDLVQLPYTRNEVNAIASLFSKTERRTFIGVEAREEKVKSEDLSHSRYLHFAAHAMIDEAFPMRSGIVLSTAPNSKEDGTLQMNEVMRLKLNADLVTLSACRTGIGQLLNGEGMIGLTRAFQYAGASNVVVSLWNVNDIATAELMKNFYENLKSGIAKDQALRDAKLQLLNGKRRTWEHPYFWAAFVLVGANN
jgi:CHAT domain-containing protein